MLAAPNRVLWALLVLFAIQYVGSAVAAENKEGQMGKAFMEMQEGATDALRRVALLRCQKSRTRVDHCLEVPKVYIEKG